MSTPPPPPGYGTLPPDPDDPRPGPYPQGQPQPSQQPMPYGQQPPMGPGPQQPPMPYGQAPMYQQPQGSSSTKTLGITALVAGIISIPGACCCWFLGWIPALIAVVCGGIGLSQSKDDPTAKDARTMLIIGIILGVLGLLLTVASAIWGVTNAMTSWDDF